MEGGSQSSQSEHADPDDPVFRQIKEAYDWLKKPRHRHEKGTAREKIAHNLHSAIHTAKGAVARNWNEVAFASSPGPDKKQVALRLILSAYCKSYSNPDDKLEEIRYRALVDAVTSAWRRKPVPTFTSRAEDIVRSFGDLVKLNEGPLSFEEMCRAHTVRSQNLCLDDKNTLVHSILPRLEACREAYLKHLKSLLTQLEELKAPEPGSDDRCPSAELYFERLSLDQQVRLVSSAQAFLFEACKARAEEGYLPDPSHLVGQLLTEVNKATLDRSWPAAAWQRFNHCVANLSAVVQLYVDALVPKVLVDKLLGLLAPAEQQLWAHVFLDTTEHAQVVAVEHTSAILRWVQSAPN